MSDLDLDGVVALLVFALAAFTLLTIIAKVSK